MRFEFQFVKNGAVSKIEHDAGDEIEVEELVYQESADEENKVEAFAEFLRTIEEHYEPSTSRYSAKRIHIYVEPGDKYEERTASSSDGTEAAANDLTDTVREWSSREDDAASRDL